MTVSKLKVAVIGTGMIANAGHIPAWKHMTGDVQVAAVANVNRRSADETALRYDIPLVYDDPQKMLDEVKPDIVSICTPNLYHKSWTIAAIHAGAHVFCEKPVATSYADAEEMFCAAQAAGRMLYVTQTSRFLTDTMAAKEIASTGKLGQVYYAEISAIRRRGIPTWGYFHMREHNAGGPLYDLGVHIIDSLFWILGNPQVKSVSGMTYTMIGNQDEKLVTSLAASGAPVGVFSPRPYDYREFNVEDFASGYIRMHDGTTILLRTSWAANLPESFNVLIAGSKAGMQLYPLKVFENLGHYQADTTIKVAPNQDVPFAGHWRAVENFVAAIQGKEEPVVKPEEVLNVIRTIEALYCSAEEGREFQL